MTRLQTDVRVTCAMCQHEWLLLDLPTSVQNLVRALKDAKCPRCGAGSAAQQVILSKPE